MSGWEAAALPVIGGLIVAILNWVRARKQEDAGAAKVITEAATAAVLMAREESEGLRADLAAARHEMAAMRVEMADLSREVHELRGAVAGLEQEREQLLRALATWRPR